MITYNSIRQIDRNKMEPETVFKLKVHLVYV